MHQTNCLVEMNLVEAVEALAKRASDLRSRPRTFHEKQAVSVSDVLTSIGDQVKNNPAFQHALLGTALGAGVSGVSTMLGNARKEEKDRRNVLQSMITGGLAGGAIGGGIGLTRHMMKGEPQGLAHGDALKPGMFQDPTTGKIMKIDPQVLKQNPELAGRVRELSQPMDPINRGIMDVTNKAVSLGTRIVPGLNWLTGKIGLTDKGEWLDKNLPITSNVLPPLAAADLAANTPNLRLGDKNWLYYPAEGAARVAGLFGQRGRAVGDWIRDKAQFSYGYINPRNSRNVEHLSEGIDAQLGERNLPQGKRDALEQLKGNRSRMEEIARDSRWRGERTSGTPGASFVGTTIKETPYQEQMLNGEPDTSVPPGKRRFNEDVFDNSIPPKVIGRREKLVDVDPIKTREAAPLSPEDIRQVMAAGAKARAERLNKSHGLSHSDPRVFRNMRGKDIEVGSMFRGRRGAGRALLYLGAPLAEYAAWQGLAQSSRENDLRELMKRYAKEVK